jgi:hypothetical protein
VEVPAEEAVAQQATILGPLAAAPAARGRDPFGSDFVCTVAAPVT